jgi:hypothetical protein
VKYYVQQHILVRIPLLMLQPEVVQVHVQCHSVVQNNSQTNHCFLLLYHTVCLPELDVLPMVAQACHHPVALIWLDAHVVAFSPCDKFVACVLQLI